MNPILLLTLEYPPQIGGIATYLSRMVDCFPVGDVQILTQKASENEEVFTHQADMTSSVPIYRRSLISSWVRPGWLPSIYQTEWLCRKDGPPSAVIVSHLLPLGLPALRLKRLRKVPYCVILHGMDAALALEAGGRKRRQAAKILHEAELVITNSRFTANLAKNLGTDESKTMIIHPSPGFASDYKVADETISGLRDRFGIQEDRFTIMSAGRLVRRKGFDDLLMALSRLKGKGKDFQYLVVGDGPDRSRLERLARGKGLAGQVIFTGSLSQEDLAAAFSLSDLFVMAPKGIGPDIEGFGIVYLEANLFKTAVIGARSGGVPDAIVDGETGILVDPGNIGELTQAILHLESNPELRNKMAEAGRKRVVSGFHWSDQCRPLVGAVLRMAKKGKL